MSDLTAEEQTNARTALRFLRVRTGNMLALAKGLRCAPSSLRYVMCGRDAVSASLAVRVARLAGVTVDDVLGGRFPPVGTCPACGHQKDDQIY